MHDDTILVAIDAALRPPASCRCGTSLTIAEHDAALWLECPRLTAPTRLPAPLAGFLRPALHDRRFVIELTSPTDPRAPGGRGSGLAGSSLAAGT